MVVTCSTRVISWSKTTPMFLAELTGVIRSLDTWIASIGGRGRWLVFRISSSIFPLFTFSLFRTNQESTWLTHASIRARDDCGSAVMDLKAKCKFGCRRRMGETRVHDVLQYCPKGRCTTSTGSFQGPIPVEHHIEDLCHQVLDHQSSRTAFWCEGRLQTISRPVLLNQNYCTVYPR